MLHNPRFLAALEVFVVGLPFCAFKALTGLLAGGWGLALLLLAALDLLFNLNNLAALARHRAGSRPVCLLAWLLTLGVGGKSEARGELGAALDVALSFLLVAVMVGGGLLGRLPVWGLQAWNAAVVLNVLGAGAFQVNQAVARLRA